MLRILIVALAIAVTQVLVANPAHAAARPYISSSSADMFWCTSQQSLCTSQTVTAKIAKGTPLRMVCWRDDRDPFDRSKKSRWFYSILDNGQEGWLWEPQVGGQVTVRSCTGINWISWSDFAIGHIDQRDAAPAETAAFLTQDWAPGKPGEWSGDCAKFAWLATGKVAYRADAIAMWRYYANRGQVDTTHRPPRGALVFWNQTKWGHVAVSLGNWQAVGTVGLDGDHLPIARYDVLGSRASTYLGWVMPQSATVPQNL